MKWTIAILFSSVLFLSLTSFFPKSGVIVYETYKVGHIPDFLILKKNGFYGIQTYEYMSQIGQTSILGTWTERDSVLFLFPNNENIGGYIEPLEKCDDCPLSKTEKYLIKGDTLFNLENAGIRFIRKKHQE